MSNTNFGLNPGVDDDNEEEYGTYCPDCGSIFAPFEEGHGQEECFECGEPNCYEIPY